jgi:hypothetical protein
MTPFNFIPLTMFLPEVLEMDDKPMIPLIPACSVLDPLESAINNTASAATDAAGLTLTILQSHLKKLCDMQIKQLSEELLRQAIDKKAPGVVTVSVSDESDPASVSLGDRIYLHAARGGSVAKGS